MPDYDIWSFVRYLCPEGRALMNAWDEALDEVRLLACPGGELRIVGPADSAWQAAKAYYQHRRECHICEVAWKRMPV